MAYNGAIKTSRCMIEATKWKQNATFDVTWLNHTKQKMCSIGTTIIKHQNCCKQYLNKKKTLSMI